MVAVPSGDAASSGAGTAAASDIASAENDLRGVLDVV